MFAQFSEEVRKVLINSKKEMINLKHSFIGTEHIVLSILKEKNNISNTLSKYQIDYKKYKNELIKLIGYGKEKNKYFIYTPLVKKILEELMINSNENKEKEITLDQLFLSLLEEGEGTAIRILLAMNIDIDELYERIFNNTKFKKKKKNQKLIIDELGTDLNTKVKSNNVDPVIGREKELSRIIEILCRRTKNNPIIIGEAGVGKSAIVEELSRRINEKSVPERLYNKRIISISMASIVSGTKYRGEFEERMSKILREIENNPEIILFIDEIHTLVGAGGAEGAIDASNILKPALARGNIRIIGATTTTEYKKYIEEDRALARRFQMVYIEEPDKNKTLEILKELKPIYENFYNINISDEILEKIIDLSDRYIHNRYQPDKSIDILDESLSKIATTSSKEQNKVIELQKQLKNLIRIKNKYIKNNDFKSASNIKENEKIIEHKINNIKYNQSKNKNKRYLDIETIKKIIESQSKIHVYELNIENSNKFSKLERALKKEVIGQNQAIEKLCLETKKVQLGYKKDTIPLSFLFVGSTGVGKTLLVKKYNDFISHSKLIRLDMSEYKEEHSVSKIIGSPPGYIGFDNKTTVLDKIKNNPQAVILLDEIEKAHPSVINLFLQVLDEGKLKKANGETIYLNDNIIMMTSNIGFHKENIGFNKNNTKKITSELRKILSVEFINRIQNIVIFNQLTKNDIKKLITKKLKEVEKFYMKKDIHLLINKKIYNKIINESNYETFGARKLNKIIEDKIDNIIIENIFKGQKEINIS